ncbi:NAD(P)H-quinone oxidoreductase [Fodinicurvata sp. EGI_FJ10296]|uniref:NAD(P)H-quinone oxidoreductase n=1 Tax=Fodinicurvata sp. EGI_FJ10296 TaxID=3231908 RepID=UPI0034572CE2
MISSSDTGNPSARDRTGDIPGTMRAVEISGPGGPEVLRIASVDVPHPDDGQVLIKVEAAGVNRPDVLQRMGKYSPPPEASPLPGLEVAGTVVGIGTGVGFLSIGQPVAALVNGGGYAEYVAVPATQCLPVPAGLSMTQAAALPETTFTVWSNLFERGGLQEGQTALIHGGSSGIGTTAIQMASLYGARVITTAGSDEKCAACENLGAARAVNYRTEDFVQAAKDMTGGRGVDVVLDMVGGDYIARNIDCMAPNARHVSIAFLGGAKVTLNMQKVMVKCLTLTGSTLRPRTTAEKAAIADGVRTVVWPWISTGRMRPIIHATFPLADAAEAHAMMERSDHIGKIVLTVA